MTIEIRILAGMLARIAQRSFEERFSTLNADINSLQYGILRSLSRESDTISELSRKFMLDPSTLVPVIDALERKGLVARGKDPNDRRRTPVSLTTAGSDLISKFTFVPDEDMLYRCLDDMGKTQTRLLLRLLREVVRRLPEGDAMLNSVSARLAVAEGIENAPPRGECPVHHRVRFENKHHPMMRRIMRRRTRRSES